MTLVDDTIGLHHVEFHTTKPQHLLDLFTHAYGFTLLAVRTTSGYCQWLLGSHRCRFVISSVSSVNSNIEKNINENYYDILTTLLADETTRSLVIDRKTVFNLAVTVKCVQSLLDRNSDVQVRSYR